MESRSPDGPADPRSARSHAPYEVRAPKRKLALPSALLEAAQPTPSPSSAEVTLEQSEPPWASGSQLQRQLWGMSAAECLLTGNIPLALEDHRILEEEELMNVNHQGHAHLPGARRTLTEMLGKPD